jgi:hypothetical protein
VSRHSQIYFSDILPLRSCFLQQHLPRYYCPTSSSHINSPNSARKTRHVQTRDVCRFAEARAVTTPPHLLLLLLLLNSNTTSTSHCIMVNQRPQQFGGPSRFGGSSQRPGQTPQQATGSTVSASPLASRRLGLGKGAGGLGKGKGVGNGGLKRHM